MDQVLICPKCNRGVFSALLLDNKKDPHDTHTYIQFYCMTCHRNALQFVVDLSPEFERNVATVAEKV